MRSHLGCPCRLIDAKTFSLNGRMAGFGVQILHFTDGDRGDWIANRRNPV